MTKNRNRSKVLGNKGCARSSAGQSNGLLMRTFEFHNLLKTNKLLRSSDLPPRTSPLSKLDPGPFEVHCTG